MSARTIRTTNSALLVASAAVSLAACTGPRWALDAPANLKDAPLAGQSFARRTATATLTNHGPGSLEVRSLRPTVSTVVNTSRGMPPFSLSEGERLELFLAGTNHGATIVTRRCGIETSAGWGVVAFPIPVRPE